jgi:iron complex outermembrane receptor protein
VNVDSATASTLDIFDPIYDQPLITDPIPDSNFEFVNNSYGFYIQDQITFAENLKLLVGGRFDVTNWRNDDFISGDSLYQIEQSFSPRIGIVYQPIPAISLYASYSQSFLPPQTEAFQEITQPERGTQYEVGIKADLSDQLAATLAFYDLTRSNVSTSDPNNPLRSIQVGEQQSRGIEFDLSGEILPGWNIIGGYALTDTEVVEDNTFEVGNQLANVPRHSASLWTTYEIQSGNLQGLGFGIGLFFVGDRQGDLANTFELPSYLRSDAAIFYERDRFRAALNFKNLFDIDYFDSASSRTNVYRGDPFIVQGTISWQF